MDILNRTHIHVGKAADWVDVLTRKESCVAALDFAHRSRAALRSMACKRQTLVGRHEHLLPRAWG